MSNRLLGNMGWLLADRLIRLGGGFAIGILVARHLGPEQFGLLSYALAFVFFFSFLSNLGLPEIMVRELKREPQRTASLLGSAFVMKLIGAALAIGLSLATVLLVRPGDAQTTMLVLIVAAGFVFQAFDVVDYYFQAQILSKYVVAARNLAFLFSSSLKILFILQDKSVTWFAAAGTLDLLFAATFMTLAYRRFSEHRQQWSLQLQVVTSLLRSAWPLMLSTLLIAIHMRIDQVMIGSMMSNRDVGLYGVAVRLSEAWYFIPGLVVTTLMPYFVELRERDYAAYLQGLRRVYSAMFWSGVLVGIMFTFLGEPLIVLLLGEVYRPASQALVLNIWAGIFVSQGVARGIWLITENLQQYRLFNNIFAVIFNIAGNLLLIPRFGIAGAAFATLATQGVSLWLVSLLWKPLRASTVELIKAVNPSYLLRGT